MTEEIFRIYDPEEKKYIKNIGVGFEQKYAEVLYSTITTVFTDSSLATLRKNIIEIRLNKQNREEQLAKLKKELDKVPDGDDMIIDDGITIDMKHVTRHIVAATEALEVADRMQIQRCTLTVENENIKGTTTDKQKKSILDRLVKGELIKKYERTITEFFLKEIKYLGRKSKREKKELYCIVWSEDMYHNSTTNRFLMAVDDLGIPFKRVDTYTRSIALYSEEDYNLFKLGIKEAYEMRDILYFKEMKKFYQQLQDNISQQIENTF